MRDDVRREVELILMRRSLGWGLVAAVLSTLLPILEVFGAGRPQILWVVTANTLIQWVVFVVRRRAYHRLEAGDSRR